MKRFFPWRLFWKFTQNYSLIGGISLALMMVSSHSFTGYRHLAWQDLAAALFTAVLVFISSLVMAYFSARPLKRVILKALKVSSRKKYGEALEMDEEIFDEEPGEYFELEMALDKIQKKIKRRRLQLAHEREEIRTLMASLNDPIVSIDQVGHISYFNSAFAAQFLSPDQLQRYSGGQPIIFAEVIRNPVILQLLNGARDGNLGRGQFNMTTHSSLGIRNFSMTFSPLREELDRQVYGVLILFHDVTDLKIAEKIRIEFVENASHELRTPLTSIKGYLETLREDLELGRMEQVPVFMSQLTKSVDRLRDLVQDLLTISSLEHQTSMNLQEVSLEEITQHAVEGLLGLASQKRILIKTKMLTDQLMADPQRIEQVLVNLVGNAIKYTQEGGVVELVWQRDPDTEEIVLIVKDNGPGIAQEHLPRLFERFYRVDRGRSRDVGGTGLGLSIVKHIVQSHGGSVQVNSQLGSGSEFICHFPKLSERAVLSL